jgi:N-acetylglucosaminyldiphosphoundecaprenol N-acetyl-beta-D-mannosaminyltransferase
MLPNFEVLGVRVHAVQMSDAVEQLRSWIRSGEMGRFVAVTGMHGVAESRQNSYFRSILNSADLVVPDGMPLIWLGRWHRYSLRRRVTGSELMQAFCRETGPRCRHFFYGGGPGVAEELACVLHEQYGITVAGTYAPPFRPLTSQEEEAIRLRVEQAAPDVLWVGLSTPKQERWMYEHREEMKVPVMVGVGAAFDMNSGKLRRAPLWMQDHGLEWLFRLIVEPQRLWRRYLVTIPKTSWFVCWELLRAYWDSARSGIPSLSGKR